ncbi:hypothetical protein COEX109129_41335 [Corallococcus exiguus]
MGTVPDGRVGFPAPTVGTVPDGRVGLPGPAVGPEAAVCAREADAKETPFSSFSRNATRSR